MGCIAVLVGVVIMLVSGHWEEGKGRDDHS